MNKIEWPVWAVAMIRRGNEYLFFDHMPEPQPGDVLSHLTSDGMVTTRAIGATVTWREIK